MTEAASVAREKADQAESKELHLGEEAVLIVFFLFGAAVFLIMSFQYPAQSRLFPTLVLVPLIVGLVIELWSALHISGKALVKEMQDRKSTLVAAFWIIVLLALMYVGGLAAGLGLFPLLYMRLYCKESWTATIAVTVVLGVGTYLFLTKLQLPMYWGLLGDILAF